MTLKIEPYFYEITSFTPNVHLLGGFFSLVVGVTSDLPHGSAGVCWCLLWGLQVKPLFFTTVDEVEQKKKAKLRSWLNRTSAVCLQHAVSLFLICEDTLYSALPLFVITSVLVFLFLHMMSVVQFIGSILDILTISFSLK